MVSNQKEHRDHTLAVWKVLPGASYGNALKGDLIPPVKYWKLIADSLSAAGWSWGCVSAIDSNGRTIWIVDAHRGDGKHCVVRAD